jgi:probable HAF family extracellular repeat protein
MKPNPRRRSCVLSIAVLIFATASFAAYAWQQSGQERPVWDVQLARNAQASSNITIQNQCQQPHTFTVTAQQTPFLQFLATPTVNVPGNSSYNLPVRFNTNGMNAGQYQGTVIVKCETCSKEKTCKQDREILPLRLTVLENAQPPQPIPTATPTPNPISIPAPTQMAEPTPTPTASPILPGATPSPTPSPSPSPSPCASPPPPTTYSVMNLGPLSESDFLNSCRATGVNNAGNVIGVCSPSYFGASGPGGPWHAFRTETGKVIDKEKDDLGLPAGITSGYAFAKGINADGHVVGYWASGSVVKAFWHDGSRTGESFKYSKVINLHPDESIFTTSRAFALNKHNDVVGAAYGPKVGPDSPSGITFGGHAVIWPGADPKKMKDLNDDLLPKYKKDWILIVAFGISDDGDIVGRAYNKTKKIYHAFLLKGVGGEFVDLGALKDKSDSSAAYAINACGESAPEIDKVVGYTLTTKSLHYGFTWTEANSLMDFGALPAYLSVPYSMESYGQAINKKGEVVGASSPASYTSFFEGFGAGPGLYGSTCVGYSRALWANGSELKELNKLIPKSPGWELDLANGINDDGLITGSGYYKCFYSTTGFHGPAEYFSHVSHAVVLIPAGFTPPPTPPPVVVPKPPAPTPEVEYFTKLKVGILPFKKPKKLKKPIFVPFPSSVPCCNYVSKGPVTHKAYFYLLDETDNPGANPYGTSISFSFDPAYITMPAGFKIPPGAKWGYFLFTTTKVTAPVTVTIKVKAIADKKKPGTGGEAEASITFTITPVP